MRPSSDSTTAINALLNAVGLLITHETKPTKAAFRVLLEAVNREAANEFESDETEELTDTETDVEDYE